LLNDWQHNIRHGSSRALANVNRLDAQGMGVEGNGKFSRQDAIKVLVQVEALSNFNKFVRECDD
jgi:hypothetical protein